MLLLLALVGCPGSAGPASSDSRSAALAQRASEVGRKAELLAAHEADLEGRFDALREAPAEGKEAVRADIQARAAALAEEARALQDEVRKIEEDARVY